jgi:hypothetical protein
MEYWGVGCSSLSITPTLQFFFGQERVLDLSLNFYDIAPSDEMDGTVKRSRCKARQY